MKMNAEKTRSKPSIWIGIALSVLLAGLVTALLLMPMAVGKPFPLPHFDKLVHASLFCFVALPSMLTAPPRWHWLVWLVVVGYSGATELIQPWFGRGSDLLDLIANAIGAGTALIFARWRWSKAAKIEQRKRA